MPTQILLDAPAMAARIAELASGLAALAEGPGQAALIGVKTRGDILARRVAELLERERRLRLPVGALDINLYRDDLARRASYPLVRGTEIPFDVEGRTILLIDDVLNTGRSIRSAIDAILDFGRPKAIRLGVLVDRGGRELPIQADVAPVKLSTRPDQAVNVLLLEQDGRDEATIEDAGA